MTEILRRYSRAARGRKLACFAAAFSLILLCLCLGIRDRKTAVIGLLICLPFLTALLFPAKGLRGALSVVLLALCAAGALFYWRVYLPYCTALIFEGKTGEFMIEVTDYPAVKDYSSVFEGRLLLDSGKSSGVRIKGFIRGRNVIPKLGDIVTMEGTVALEDDRYFLKAASEGRYLIIKGKDDNVRLRQPDKMPLEYYPKYFAETIRSKVDEYFTGDENALISALLTGSKREMSHGFRNNLGLSGTSHITAVSGMHVGIIAGIVVYLLGKRYGLLMALPVMIFFSISTGFNPPVIRSLLMAAITLGAFLADRENDAVTSVMTALMLILIFNPEVILSVSLQLSFASVMGIILLSEPVYRTLNAYMPIAWSENRIAEYINRSVSVTISATFAVLPFSVFYFDRVSVVSAAANFAVLWMVPIMMITGFIFAFLSFFWEWGAYIASLFLGSMAELFIAITEAAASVRFSSVPSKDILSIAALSAVSLILILGYTVRPRLRKYTVAVFILLAAVPLLLSVYSENREGCLRISGDGLAMIKYKGEVAAAVPESSSYGRIENDYFSSLYEWGRAKPHTVIFCGETMTDSESNTFKAENLVHPTKSYDLSRREHAGETSVQIFDGGKGFDCMFESEDFNIIWLCGSNTGKSLPEPKGELLKTNILIIDGRLATDYFQAHKLFERVEPETVIICNMKEKEKYAFSQIFGGERYYIDKGDSLTLPLRSR